MIKYPGLRDVVGTGDHRILRAVYDRVAETFGDVVPRAIGLVHGAINVFAVAIMGVYLSLHPALYREWLIALFPPIHRDLVRDVLGDLGLFARDIGVDELQIHRRPATDQKDRLVDGDDATAAAVGHLQAGVHQTGFALSSPTWISRPVKS